MLVAAAPSAMKTTLNPSTNVRECSITVRSIRCSDDWRSSTLVPEIRDTYPGTSGSTHGERNERIPARNAAIGNGKLCIVIYCNNVPKFRYQAELSIFRHNSGRKVTPKRYTKVWLFAAFRGRMRMDGFRSPDHVSEMTMESPGLCGSYFTEASKPNRQE